MKKNIKEHVLLLDIFLQALNQASKLLEADSSRSEIEGGVQTSLTTSLADLDFIGPTPPGISISGFDEVLRTLQHPNRPSIPSYC